MKIYTRKGDTGSTQLLGGRRVSKHHLRIEAYGTVDELNAFVGSLRDQAGTDAHQQMLQWVQDRLFVIGSNLATEPEKAEKIQLSALTAQDVTRLEESMDGLEAELPPLTNFVLPGGHPSNSAAHLCRTVCRRAERQAVLLADNESVNELIITFLNRLSDWFFMFARWLSHTNGADEIVWVPQK